MAATMSGSHERQGRDHERQGRDHERQGRDHERQWRDHERQGREQKSTMCAKGATIRTNEVGTQRRSVNRAFERFYI